MVLDARERSQDGDSYVYDLEVRDPSGSVVERWEGLTLRAIRKRDGAGPWTPTMLGSYLERNMQLFGEIQKTMQEQSQKLYGEPTKSNEDLWKQFMNFQGPAMQSLISAYMEQSRNVFLQMQEQLRNQTRNMFSGFTFPGFPGVPGFGTPPNSAQPPSEKTAPGEEKKT